MNMTGDGGYIIDIDTETVNALVAEMDNATQYIEDMYQNPETSAWVTNAVESIMVDPTFDDVRDKALAFERRFALPLAVLFNRLIETNAQLIAVQDPAEIDAWMNAFDVLVGAIEKEAQGSEGTAGERADDEEGSGGENGDDEGASEGSESGSEEESNEEDSEGSAGEEGSDDEADQNEDGGDNDQEAGEGGEEGAEGDEDE